MSPSAQNVEETISHSNAAPVPAWKQELNDRLAATRSRRLRSTPEQAALPGLEEVGLKNASRASRLAAKVAQRYANAPSYSDLLAAEARARAVARERRASEAALAAAQAVPTAAAFPAWQLGPQSEGGNAVAAAGAGGEALAEDRPDPEEQSAVEPLAVNLIEFPRELVASRKIRPRLAEGPLRETTEEAHQGGSKQGVSIGPAPSHWSPILLDTTSTTQPGPRATAGAQIPLQAASLEDRLMAAIFDLALVTAAFALFVLVFVACTTHPPVGRSALVGGGVALVCFGLLYHYLFFRFADGTPGMRYARIALCTFEDENPSRQAMCWRVLFLVLSAAPLGLGFLWACFDQDRLGWHDRITRMYQRSYS